MINLKRKNKKISKNDIPKLFKIVQDEVSRGVKLLDIEIDNCEDRIIDAIKSFSGKRYHFYDELILRIKNIPPCLLKQPEGVVFFDGNKSDFSKDKKCKNCKYDFNCWGYSKKDSKYIKGYIEAIPSIPKEIMIEIEEKCNLDCEFCFNKNSFAEHGRDIKNKLSNDYVKKIVDNAKESGIKAIRFTGGEPLLRDDIWDLAKYVKEKNLELRLNTNAVLVRNMKTARKIVEFFDNILVPIHYSDFAQKSEIAKKKIKAIYFLKKAGIEILRGGSVATKEVIKNLPNFHELVENLGFDKWELYRRISTPGNINSFSEEDVRDLVEGLIDIRKKTGKAYSIVNAIPFCSYDPLKVRSVSIGAEAVDGHERFAVDPRGFAKPLYYMRENIGSPLDVMACWNNDFMKKMRSLEFLPKDCYGCIFKEKCRGGCRFSANISGGSYDKHDPLINLDNRIAIKNS